MTETQEILSARGCVRVTARQNPLIKRLSALQTKKGRREEGMFFTEGRTLFCEAVSKGIIPEYTVISDGFELDVDAVTVGMLEGTESSRIISVPEQVYEKLTDETAPEGMFCAYKLSALKNYHVINTIDSTEKPLARGNYIILESVRDPGNVGTVLRSAAAFGLAGAVLCDTCDPFSPKVQRGAMGAAFSLPIYETPDISVAAGLCASAGCRIYAAALKKDAAPLSEELFRGGCACVMIGNEGSGLTQEAISLADKTVIIPISGMESLNAAAAAAIFIYEMRNAECGMNCTAAALPDGSCIDMTGKMI